MLNTIAGAISFLFLFQPATPATGPSLLGTCVKFTETGAVPVDCPGPTRIPVSTISKQVLALMCTEIQQPVLPRQHRSWKRLGRRAPEPKRQVCLITSGTEK